MVWLRRIGFFFLLNLTVLIMVSIIVRLIGVDPSAGRIGSSAGYGPMIVLFLIYGMVGSFISLAMSRWVAKWSMGVQVIDPNTTDPTARALVETVYRLSQSAGLRTMPEVGIYESPEVNAFATGPTKNRSLVAVSTGLLNRMDRPSLEGVLGHEITHITNGDMVTMALLQGVVNAFVMVLARIIAFAIDNALRSRNDNGRGLGYFGQYIAVIVLEMLLFIPGSMVIATFSRFREFRADAGGARLAGQGQMIRALRSLQSLKEINEDPRVQTSAAFSSMKIAKSGGSKFTELFSSHPPLEVRIARLEGRA